MEKQRDVKKSLSIFDLRIYKALNLPASILTRVMFLYDRKEDKKEFKVLDNRISPEMRQRIRSWLEENICDYDSIRHYKDNEVDADNFQRAVNC